MNLQAVRRGEHLVTLDTAVDVSAAQEQVMVRVLTAAAAGQELVPQTEQVFGGGRVRGHAREQRPVAGHT